MGYLEIRSEERMRGLTKKQKEILQNWFKEHKDAVGLFFRIEDCEDFDILDDLREINDFEGIVTHINNYLSDLACEVKE